MVKTVAYKLAEVKAKKVRTHYAMCRPFNCTTNLLPRLQRLRPRQLTAQCAICRPRHWWTAKLTRY